MERSDQSRELRRSSQNAFPFSQFSGDLQNGQGTRRPPARRPRVERIPQTLSRPRSGQAETEDGVRKGPFDEIRPVAADLSIPDGAKCQEASMFSRDSYIPCGAPAIAIVDNG